MADFRAIEGISNSIVHLLRVSYNGDDFGNELNFQVYAHADFAQPMAAGISVFLYRVIQNGTHRIPGGRRDVTGRRREYRLPVDLHYMLTVWSRDASLQHRITGWMMRTMEDVSILPHGLLEAVAAGVFHPSETVELVLNELTNEDLFRIWDTLGQSNYQLSIPYIARNVWIESIDESVVGREVHDRLFDWASINA